VLDAYGFEVVQRLPGIQGSWFRKFLIQTRAGAPSAEEYESSLLARSNCRRSADRRPRSTHGERTPWPGC
jgi:hypothetical protein